jgi:hypothetical protein
LVPALGAAPDSENAKRIAIDLRLLLRLHIDISYRVTSE